MTDNSIIRHQWKPKRSWYLGAYPKLYSIQTIPLWHILYIANLLYVGWMESKIVISKKEVIVDIGGFWCLVLITCGILFIIKTCRYREKSMMLARRRTGNSHGIWIVRADRQGITTGIDGISEVTYDWQRIRNIIYKENKIEFDFGKGIGRLVIHKLKEVSDQFDSFSTYLRQIPTDKPSDTGQLTFITIRQSKELL